MSTLSGGPSVVTNGLLVWLDAGNIKSYVSGSTTWTDLSRNASNGTLINGPTFNTGSGGYILFDGLNDYCDITIPTINSYDTITICGFIKWISFNSGMFLGFTTYDVWTSGNTLGYNNGNSNVIGINTSTVTSLGLLGNWRHYTFVMNKTGSLSTNKIYINGVSQGNLTAVVAADGLIPGFNTNLRLALWNNTTSSYNGNLQYGNLQVYNRELTAQEVLQNYNATKGRFGL